MIRAMLCGVFLVMLLGLTTVAPATAADEPKPTEPAAAPAAVPTGTVQMGLDTSNLDRMQRYQVYFMVVVTITILWVLYSIWALRSDVTRILAQIGGTPPVIKN